jgi:N-acetylglucosaminyldiphosphoundecaprenol N-acetyl-beta-D-mannosaminyltransferase
MSTDRMSRQRSVVGDQNISGTIVPATGPALPYANVLGVKVAAIDLQEAIRRADLICHKRHSGYVCLTGVHGVMEAQSDVKLRSVLNGAFLNLPDGMPMTWVGWLQGHRRMDRVFGPEFMLEFCRFSVSRGYRHYLYGGDVGVATQLKESLLRSVPGLNIVGTFTPPFRPLDANEAQDLIEDIKRTQPDIVWVGLSTPKQERFMAEYLERLQVSLMIGVGAAFDYHTGRVRDCAPWIKRAGLQWLHRLLQDPRRLWRRYLTNNPRFLWYITLQLFGFRRDT